MKKLIRGIVEFRNNLKPEQAKRFAQLALGQRPDALFIICSDSRVAPNVFASTDPGDLFVVRNVGNLVPPSGKSGLSIADESEVAAIEFALLNLGVRDIIVCGHSECGAMVATLHGRQKLESMPHLKSWLRHAEPAHTRLKRNDCLPGEADDHNKLSQLNVLQQLEHLKTYALVQERLDKGQLRLHGWWFNIGKAEVHDYNSELNRFVPLDQEEASRIIERLDLAGAS